MREILDKCQKLFVEQKFEEALEVSEQIIKQDPEKPHYNLNHALILSELNRIEEAIIHFEKASNARPGCPVLKNYLSDMCFRVGRFREGFANREWRFTRPIEDSYCPNPVVFTLLPRVRELYDAPDWDGKSDLTGKRVVIFNEAGFGDFIQSTRYIKHLKEAGASAILVANSELYRIFKNVGAELAKRDKLDKMDGWTRSFTNLAKKAMELPEHDYVMSVNSMNHFFDPNIEYLPKGPYLFLSDDEPKNPALKIVDKYKNKFKIGLCFAGKPKDYHDCFRSIFLRQFKPLSDLKYVQLFSLQKGEMNRKWRPQMYERGCFEPVNLMDGSETINFENLEPYINDFYDVAEIASHLDLVISVDTSIAHLMGAIGKPVWMLCSKPNHEWRWQKRWYESMEIFSQQEDGDWDGVILGLVEILEKIT